MSPFKKFILIVLLLGVTLMTIYVYFIFLNTGQLMIRTDGVGNYGIFLDDVAYPCFSDPCSLKLKSGKYELTIDKAGFYRYSGDVEVARGGETEISPALEEIPALKESNFSKELSSDPGLPSSPEGTLGGVWNASQNRYLFLDAMDEKLKIRTGTGEPRVVTTLKNLSEPIEFFWSPNEREAIVASENEIYFIRTELGSRNKFIADFSPTQALWTPAFILLSSEDEIIYKVAPDTFNEAERANLKFNLGSSLDIGGKQLIAYRATGNATQILLIDLEKEVEEIIAEKLDFLVDDIYYDSALSIAYFRESESQTWYEIKIKK